MKFTPDFDIAICGGGMVGATFAALLSNEPSLADLRIALIESRLPVTPPPAGVELRVSAISRASERILTRAGAWQLLPAAQRCAYQQMRVWDAHTPVDAAAVLQFSASALGEPNLGYIIANNWLQWVSLEATRQGRVTCFAAELSSIELTDTAATIRLQDGRQITTRLVVGADGANSMSRACVGIQTQVRAYQQSAVVTQIRTERPHQFTAWQRFMPTGPLAFLPLNDGTCSIVWTTTPEHAVQLLALDTNSLATEVASASDHILGDIKVLAKAVMFPLQVAHVDQYSRPRFVLVGDAAHSIHPLAGQGVNLGLMDAASLVQVLTQARQAGASLDSLSELAVLRRYERWRKTENTLALGLVDSLNRLFSNEYRSAGVLRRSGLAAIEKVAVLKRSFMLRALGLAGEVPDIVRQAS